MNDVIHQSRGGRILLSAGDTHLDCWWNDDCDAVVRTFDKHDCIWCDTTLRPAVPRLRIQAAEIMNSESGVVESHCCLADAATLLEQAAAAPDAVGELRFGEWNTVYDVDLVDSRCCIQCGTEIRASDEWHGIGRPAVAFHPSCLPEAVDMIRAALSAAYEDDIGELLGDAL